MQYRLIVAQITVFSLLALNAAAETYSWVDSAGTVNFTENLAEVPKKYRKKMRRLGDAEPSQSEPKAVATKTQTELDSTAKDVSKSAQNGKEQQSDSYGGKSYQQWKDELQRQEQLLDKNSEEIAAIDKKLKESQSKKENTQQLIADRKSAVARYYELREKYEKSIADARKAGIKIDMK